MKEDLVHHDETNDPLRETLDLEELELDLEDEEQPRSGTTWPETPPTHPREVFNPGGRSLHSLKALARERECERVRDQHRQVLVRRLLVAAVLLWCALGCALLGWHGLRSRELERRVESLEVRR